MKYVVYFYFYCEVQFQPMKMLKKLISVNAMLFFTIIFIGYWVIYIEL